MLPFRPNSNKQVVLARKKPVVPFSLWLDGITNGKSRVRVAASPRFRRRSVVILQPSCLSLCSEGCSLRSLRVTVANDWLQGLGVKGFPDEAVSDTISSHLHTATS